jgi:hypothetical protein
MFGQVRPPRPPRYEPILMLLVAVGIAASLTVAGYAFLVFAQRLQEAG